MTIDKVLSTKILIELQQQKLHFRSYLGQFYPIKESTQSAATVLLRVDLGFLRIDVALNTCALL